MQKTIYILPNKEKITISYEHLTLLAHNAEGVCIGSIELDYREENDAYKIVYMYLDKAGEKYLRQGIGRRSLEFFKEIEGTQIFASSNDGQPKEDGSHLTGDAPAFVHKMMEEGILLNMSEREYVD